MDVRIVGEELEFFFIMCSERDWPITSQVRPINIDKRCHTIKEMSDSSPKILTYIVVAIKWTQRLSALTTPYLQEPHLLERLTTLKKVSLNTCSSQLSNITLIQYIQCQINMIVINVIRYRRKIMFTGIENSAKYLYRP